MAGRATGDERGSVCCDLEGHGNEINLKFSYGESVRMAGRATGDERGSCVLRFERAR